MRFDDTVWKRWNAWLPRIRDDLQHTAADNATFSEFRKVVAANSTWIDSFHGGHFCAFVARSYLSRAALGLRRQVKVSKDRSISLMRLLTQIAACAPQITYGHYLVIFPKSDGEPPWQWLTFGRLSKDGFVLSRELVELDIAKLRELSASIEQYGDRVVAHLEQIELQTQITWKEIEDAIDEFDRTACRYISLLTGDGYDSLRPTVVFNWKQVFDHPLRAPLLGPQPAVDDDR